MRLYVCRFPVKLLLIIEQIHPGNIEVEHVVSQVANGEVWVINGVLNYL